MTDCCVIRIDATHSLGVRAGDCVREGQSLLTEKETEGSCICPVSGVIEEIHFDPSQHEFVVSISPLGSDT